MNILNKYKNYILYDKFINILSSLNDLSLKSKAPSILLKSNCVIYFTSKVFNVE